MARITWRVEELAAQRGWSARQLAALERTAGSAGSARAGDLEGVLAGAWSEQTDPGLERALRST